MSNATLNRVTQSWQRGQRPPACRWNRSPSSTFVAPVRRCSTKSASTATGLKCLAHEDGRSSRSIYNKAEYAEQRRHILQEWANMVDAWVEGGSYTPALLPSNTVLPVLSASA